MNYSRPPLRNNLSLPRRTLFCYGLADMPVQVVMIPVLSLIPAYYTANLGITVGAAGAVLLASRLFDAVTDPLIGWLSDRTKSRFGRRRLWMVASVPVFMLATYKLFFPVGSVDALYLVTWLTVLWLGWTLLYIPFTHWGRRSRQITMNAPASRLGDLESVSAPMSSASWCRSPLDFCWECPPLATTCS